MTTCTKCKSNLTATDKFCPQCGATVGGIHAPPLPQRNAPPNNRSGAGDQLIYIAFAVVLLLVFYAFVPVLVKGMGVDVSTFPPLLQAIIYGGGIFLLVVFLAALKILFRK